MYQTFGPAGRAFRFGAGKQLRTIRGVCGAGNAAAKLLKLRDVQIDLFNQEIIAGAAEATSVESQIFHLTDGLVEEDFVLLQRLFRHIFQVMIGHI